jgi:uncharacterized paraquat-inducible protein A
MNKIKRLRAIKRRRQRLRAKLKNIKAKGKRANKQTLPSTLQMAKNFGNSVVKNVTNVVKGEQLKATSEKSKERINICLKCKFITGKPSNERCGKCGCWLRLKTQLQSESCPIGKW